MPKVDDQRLKGSVRPYYIEMIQHYLWPGKIITFRVGSGYF